MESGVTNIMIGGADGVSTNQISGSSVQTGSAPPSSLQMASVIPVSVATDTTDGSVPGTRNIILKIIIAVYKTRIYI